MYLIETLGSVHVKIDVWTRPKSFTHQQTSNCCKKYASSEYHDKRQHRTLVCLEANLSSRYKFLLRLPERVENFTEDTTNLETHIIKKLILKRTDPMMLKFPRRELLQLNIFVKHPMVDITVM